MKIVVIGGTRHIRSATVERLRRQGHEVVAAPLKPCNSTITAAPRDPGYAGRPLREFLEKPWLGRFQPCIGGREIHGPAEGRENGIRSGMSRALTVQRATEASAASKQIILTGE